MSVKKLLINENERRLKKFYQPYLNSNRNIPIAILRKFQKDVDKLTKTN